MPTMDEIAFDVAQMRPKDCTLLLVRFAGVPHFAYEAMGRLGSALAEYAAKHRGA